VGSRALLLNRAIKESIGSDRCNHRNPTLRMQNSYMVASLLYIFTLLFSQVSATRVSFVSTGSNISYKRKDHLRPLSSFPSNSNEQIIKDTIETNLQTDKSPIRPCSRRIWLTDTATVAAGLVLGTTTWGSKPAFASISSLCDPSVSVLKNYSNNRVVYILGTAHISSNSAKLAGQLVNEIRPDAVFVELDAKRVGRASSKSSSSSSSSTLPATTISNQQDDSSAVTLKGSTPSTSPSPLLTTEPSSATTTTASNNKIGIFNLRERAVEASSQMLGDAIKVGFYKTIANFAVVHCIE